MFFLSANRIFDVSLARSHHLIIVPHPKDILTYSSLSLPSFPSSTKHSELPLRNMGVSLDFPVFTESFTRTHTRELMNRRRIDRRRRRTLATKNWWRPLTNCRHVTFCVSLSVRRLICIISYQFIVIVIETKKRESKLPSGASPSRYHIINTLFVLSLGVCRYPVCPRLQRERTVFAVRFLIFGDDFYEAAGLLVSCFYRGIQFVCKVKEKEMGR